MRVLSRSLSLAATLTLGLALGSAPALAADKGAMAQLKDASGKIAGTITLRDMGNHLMGTIDVSGLTPGDHGIHVHTTGQCEGPKFTSAGGHLNPDGKKHGLKNAEGPHQGDMPQLAVGADGKAKQEVTVNSTLAAVLDTDGAAFIVHAGPDDQTTDPSGNSGDRILCGVFTPIS